MVFGDLWRAVSALLLLLSIATHGLRPVDLDFDLHPAPFSAYDDDIVRASLGPSRNAPDLKAVSDALGGEGKRPASLFELNLPRRALSWVASTGSQTWIIESAAEAITGTSRLPYLPRGPPAA
jgi:hypothetical protein